MTVDKLKMSGTAAAAADTAVAGTVVDGIAGSAAAAVHCLEPAAAGGDKVERLQSVEQRQMIFHAVVVAVVIEQEAGSYPHHSCSTDVPYAPSDSLLDRPPPSLLPPSLLSLAAADAVLVSLNLWTIMTQMMTRVVSEETAVFLKSFL